MLLTVRLLARNDQIFMDSNAFYLLIYHCSCICNML